jgi:glycosyltransferase involved in cell wall biosynthesis
MPPERVRRLYAPVDDAWFEPRSGGSMQVGTQDDFSPDDVSAGIPKGRRPSARLREEFGLMPDAPVILNVARLSPIKGHEHLLRAMASVVRSVPSAVLLLVGEPWSGQPEGLAKQAGELGIESSVVFAGRRENVRDFVLAADLCVSSSTGSEENSRAVAEYMAAGRPVVATSVGVIPELVADGETGLLVPPGSPEVMAQAIIAMLSDAGSSRSMGERARESALSRFSASAFVDGLTEVLKSAEVRV